MTSALLYTGGTVIGAVAYAVGLSVLGAMVDQDRVLLAATSSLAAIFALLSATGRRPVITGRMWQVPRTWVRRGQITGFFYAGLALGMSVLTPIRFPSFVILTGCLLILPLDLAAGVGLTFGLVRGLPSVRTAVGPPRPGFTNLGSILVRRRDGLAPLIDASLAVFALTILAAVFATRAEPSPLNTRSVRGVIEFETTSCPRGSVPAVIEGSRRCLRAGNRCSVRLDRSYHRYGFHCHNGRLRRDYLLTLRRRPLRTPTINPGETCPLTASTGQLSAIDRRLSPHAQAFGIGPVYPGLYPPTATTPPDQPILGIGFDPTFGARGWASGKVIWVVDATRGPYPGDIVLVRGRQVDGKGEVRFGDGLLPALEQRLTGGGVKGSSIRVRHEGCFAVQIDIVGRVSRFIIFSAKFGP